ncbi:hypothetical protein SAY87_026369 [Trapa incisa]|uniref:Glycine-rich protein n=1 Tax=Trapa incisa TaxID=236973 RepID=A0AAN7GVA6_9MYRT|nr:hypothetical protein SAY87_026369 [Trapa incisa]
MAYVERGVVKSQRSIWRLRTVTDFFWAIVNFICVFFTTMFSMEKSDAYRKGSSSSKKWDGGGPGGGPGRGPYGGGPRGPPRGLDNVRGIDHSKSVKPYSFPSTNLALNFSSFLIEICICRFSSRLWFLLWRLSMTEMDA